MELNGKRSGSTAKVMRFYMLTLPTNASALNSTESVLQTMNYEFVILPHQHFIRIIINMCGFFLEFHLFSTEVFLKLCDFEGRLRLP